MSKKEHSHNQEIQEEIYRSPFKHKTTLIATVSFCFLLGLFISFDMKHRVTTAIETLLKHSLPCPITYSKLDISLFPLPHLKINNAKIPLLCLGQTGEDLEIDSATVQITGPSFIPVGVDGTLKLRSMDNDILFNLKLGIGKVIVRSEGTKIKSEMISALIGQALFSGNLELSTLLSIDSQGIQSGDLLIKSKDVTILKQQVSGLIIPQQKIGQLLIKGSITDRTIINLQEIILGNSNAPIQSSINGTIRLQPDFIANSSVDLKGEIKFSPDFINDFPILDLFISGKNANASGFYPFNVKGTIGSPVPQFM